MRGILGPVGGSSEAGAVFGARALESVEGLIGTLWGAAGSGRNLWSRRAASFELATLPIATTED